MRAQYCRSWTNGNAGYTSLATQPAHVDGVDDQPLVHRGRGEDSPGPGTQVPGEQEVALQSGVRFIH